MNSMLYRGNLASADTTRKLSPNIWADCPIRDIIERKTRNGIFRYDDFSDLPLAPTLTTQIAFGRYKAFANTGCAIDRVTTINSVEVAGGALRQTIDTDNDGVSIADAYPSFLLSGLTSNSGPLWFECCYAQKSLVTNMAAVFIGLAETEQWTQANGVPFNAGDPITNSASAIGFRIEEDGLGVVDTVYSDRATSFTNIGDTEGGTLVAYTFTKFAMKYDPNETDNCIRFYVNNQELSTKLTRAALIARTNLDANALGLLWASCGDSAGTTFEGYMKWWACSQLFEPL